MTLPNPEPPLPLKTVGWSSPRGALLWGSSDASPQTKQNEPFVYILQGWHTWDGWDNATVRVLISSLKWSTAYWLWAMPQANGFKDQADLLSSIFAEFFLPQVCVTDELLVFSNFSRYALSSKLWDHLLKIRIMFCKSDHVKVPKKKKNVTTY